MTKAEAIQAEALDRARNGQSAGNYGAIMRGFMAKGIPAHEILPRENVFTYHAWQALGRQVRRMRPGEHGVKIVTYIPMTRKNPDTGEREPSGRRPKSTTVFHVSQTDPMQDGS